MLSDPFDSFAADMSATFRAQREWAQRRGLLLISAHFLTGVGGGAWIVGALADYRPSLFVGLALALIGGLFHLGFLGHAERFWRMVSSFRTSWISRGLVGVGVFSLSAILYLIVAYTSGTGGALERALLVLTLVGAIWICVYKGFVWASARGVPFWNSGLLPAVFIAYALRGGIAVLFVSLLVSTPAVDVNPLEVIKLWIGVSSAALVVLYLAGMPSAGGAAERSVSELVRGRLSLAFYVGAVFFGLVVPIVVGAYASGYSIKLSDTWIGLIGLSSIIGDFYTILSIARAGIYRPLSMLN